MWSKDTQCFGDLSIKHNRVSLVISMYVAVVFLMFIVRHVGLGFWAIGQLFV